MSTQNTVLDFFFIINIHILSTEQLTIYKINKICIHLKLHPSTAITSNQYLNIIRVYTS